MARNYDITSANATAFMVTDVLYPNGFSVEMFAADTAVSIDSIDLAEVRMGVDGQLVAGYTPNPLPVTITIESASPTFDYFVQIYRKTVQERMPYRSSLTITMKAIGRVFTFQNGFLTSATPFPTMATTLDPTTWVFNFEAMDMQGA